MARKIGIIGMGNVGAAVAHGAIAQGLADSYVFIDINEKKSEADAQDFKDAMANLPSYANIVVNLLEKPFIRFLRNLKNWIFKEYSWLSRIL